MVIYRHVQAGTLMRWSFGAAAAGTLLVIATDSTGSFVSLLGLGVFATCLILFHSLTTTVGFDAVVVSFGPGWIRRSVPLASIRTARTVQNPWWYGWGIRLTPSGWLWNVSGLAAVELDLQDGSRLRIGTDEPERLLTAIEQAARLGR